MVAKAWVDPDFRRWLLTDTTAAIASLGYGGRQGETMVALENTDPRGVLHDFGVELSADTQIRVWDSTAELRYLVVPRRPVGTDDWRKRARPSGHARLDDRGWPAQAATGRAVMNGAQDMGGVHGFGAVLPEADEPVFHANWEWRVHALTLAMGATGEWTLDALRFACENRPPAEYLSKSYYQVWLAGLQQLLGERGLVAPVWARPLARCQRFTVSVDAFEPYLEPAR